MATRGFFHRLKAVDTQVSVCMFLIELFKQVTAP